MSGWNIELLADDKGGAWFTFWDSYGADRVYRIATDGSVVKQVWADDAFSESNPDPEPELVPVNLGADLLELLTFLTNRQV